MKWRKLEYYRLRECTPLDCELSFDISVSSGIIGELCSLDCRYSGQVGYVLLGMRNSREAHIGDTFHHTGSKVSVLPGFRAAKPMV